VSFTRAGTPVVPFERSTTLVTGGSYRFTRNPIYLCMVLMLSGVAALLGTLSPWLVMTSRALRDERLVESRLRFEAPTGRAVHRGR
jgi:protein-S-isoprenylcysteine O-methyltransferase Ste14